jgi:outer membrane protein OmpA-like peptidoglycan-associated protein
MFARIARFSLLGLGVVLVLSLAPLQARADWRWHGRSHVGFFVGGWPGFYPYYAPYAYYPPPYYYPPPPYAPAYYRPPPPPPPVYGPAPTAAPAPLASQARSFRVFFEFDKASLSREAERIVREAADAYRRTGTARVEVVGYTDLSGTRQYDLGLSQRRAQSVRAALVAQGVPVNSITQRWRGKDDPLVATPDGVREPQNRRVDIVINRWNGS